MLIDVGDTGSLLFNVGAVRSKEKGVGRRGAGYRVAANLHAMSQKEMHSKRGRAVAPEQDDHIIELLQSQKHTCVLKVVAAQAGESLTLEAVGEVMSITRERVRQIQDIAIGKVRAAPPSEYEEMTT